MSLSRQILLINRQLLAYYKKELEAADVGLGLADMLFLSYFYGHDGCRQDDLVKDFGWDKAHVTRHLQELEQRQLLTRRVDPSDKRAKRIHPTDLAWSHEGLIRGIQQGWNQQVCEGYAGQPEEIEAVLSHLLKKAKTLALGELDS